MVALALLACTIPVADHHPLDGTIVDVGGSTVVIQHDGLEGVLDAGETSFISEPNLSRQVNAGDEVDFFFLTTDDGPRVIGFEVTGHTVLRPQVVAQGEVFPSWTIPSTTGGAGDGGGSGAGGASASSTASPTDSTERSGGAPPAPTPPDFSRRLLLEPMFQPLPEPDEIDLLEGDTIDQAEDLGGGWWRGRNARSGEVGAFPASFME